MFDHEARDIGAGAAFPTTTMHDDRSPLLDRLLSTREVFIHPIVYRRGLVVDDRVMQTLDRGAFREPFILERSFHHRGDNQFRI